MTLKEKLGWGGKRQTDAPDYDILQRLRASFYGIELYLLKIENSSIDSSGHYWLTVNGEPIEEPWLRLADDKPDNFYSRWAGKVAERAAQNAVERIARIQAAYAEEVDR